MEIQLTPEQDGFIQHAIAQGHYRSKQEVVDSALALWEERERERLELIEMIAEGQRSLDAGEGTTIDTAEDMEEFFKSIASEGSARLAEK